MAAPVALALFAEINTHVPEDTNTNLLMVFRWIHLIAGITWIGLLYFFNLVSVPLMKELDASTRGKVFPALMLRALWWFRMAAVITVLFGLAYWGNVVASDARNAGASAGGVFGSFFLIWTVVWGLMYGLLTPGKGILNRGPVIAIAYTIILLVACWAFLDWNNRGWGEQSPARHRPGRRHRLGDDVERMGRDLAHPETHHSMDPGQRSQRHAHPRRIESHVACGLPHFPGQRLLVDSPALPHGCRQPLSHVREPEIRGGMLFEDGRPRPSNPSSEDPRLRTAG